MQISSNLLSIGRRLTEFYTDKIFCMVSGYVVSMLQTFVLILNHASRSITWSLLTWSNDYSQYRGVRLSIGLNLKLTPVPCTILEWPTILNFLKWKTFCLLVEQGGQNHTQSPSVRPVPENSVKSNWFQLVG